jgi:hypothetical protein
VHPSYRVQLWVQGAAVGADREGGGPTQRGRENAKLRRRILVPRAAACSHRAPRNPIQQLGVPCRTGDARVSRKQLEMAATDSVRASATGRLCPRSTLRPAPTPIRTATSHRLPPCLPASPVRLGAHRLQLRPQLRIGCLTRFRPNDAPDPHPTQPTPDPQPTAQLSNPIASLAQSSVDEAAGGSKGDGAAAAVASALAAASAAADEARIITTCNAFV